MLNKLCVWNIYAHIYLCEHVLLNMTGLTIDYTCDMFVIKKWYVKISVLRSIDYIIRFICQNNEYILERPT